LSREHHRIIPSSSKGFLHRWLTRAERYGSIEREEFARSVLPRLDDITDDRRLAERLAGFEAM
jgi:hypothetical protein